MLEPRKVDIPALFLVLVVLPVLLYILLGKCSETSKRKGRRSLILDEIFEESVISEPMSTAEESFEEYVISEPMSTASDAPFVVPFPISLIRECARCHGPARTRCSRCKSVRYCSGKCQISHWRQGHKDECQPSDFIDSSSLDGASVTMDFSHDNYTESHGFSSQFPLQEQIYTINPNGISDDISHTFSATVGAAELSTPESRVSEIKVPRRKTKEMADVRNKPATIFSDANLQSTPTISTEANPMHELRANGSAESVDSYPDMHHMNHSVISDGYSGQMYCTESPIAVHSQSADSFSYGKRAMDEVGVGIEYTAPAREVSRFSQEVSRKSSSLHLQSCNGSNGTADLESFGLPKLGKLVTREGREQAHPTKLRKANGSDESAAGAGTSTSVHENDGAVSSGLRKMTGLKKFSKMFKQDAGMDVHRIKKVKALFPFQVFARFFEHQIFDLSPRGLQNCGNSCYANAVLQCLTCTKPLVVYLLSRMHSRACRRKSWCLMCELEQHVMMLKESGDPLSPSKILSHIRGINCQIGDGSQEDAHEFLRLLVGSMQSICLEEVGGENQVHPTLQETTFILQTFGGRLRSQVECLRCHHESERYENIMDLTLEIYGWVESLEDALTQFTTPEHLDGENMYRCERCSSYVPAKKQLSIDEAPNILTIVLKRFQEGSYGKINKCITFPEMLEMVPYMTGTNDVPPPYMLYGVVVHVDTLNASFSGHYVSYVKDLKGNWYRIDDSVVQPVPTSQVMSEGAYILFYTRSFPRRPRACLRKARKNQPTMPSDPCGQNAHWANRFPQAQARETYTEPNIMEFSDATPSDWSLFTSSDEASFTSDSTRDSFSIPDHSDMCHFDPFTSMFSHPHPSHGTVSCRMFSGSQPTTQYISEETGYILDSENYVNHETNYPESFVTSFNDLHL